MSLTWRDTTLVGLGTGCLPHHVLQERAFETWRSTLWPLTIFMLHRILLLPLPASPARVHKRLTQTRHPTFALVQQPYSLDDRYTTAACCTGSPMGTPTCTTTAADEHAIGTGHQQDLIDIVHEFLEWYYDREWERLTATADWNDAAQLLREATIAIFQNAQKASGSTQAADIVQLQAAGHSNTSQSSQTGANGVHVEDQPHYQDSRSNYGLDDEDCSSDGDEELGEQHAPMPDLFLTLLQYLPGILMPSTSKDHSVPSFNGHNGSNGAAQDPDQRLAAAITQFWLGSGLLDGIHKWQDEESEQSLWCFDVLKAYLVLLQAAGIQPGQPTSSGDGKTAAAAAHVVDMMCDSLSDSLAGADAYDNIVLDDWAGLVELLADTDYRSAAVDGLLNKIIPEITLRAVLIKTRSS